MSSEHRLCHDLNFKFVCCFAYLVDSSMDICFALLSARQSDILYTSAQNRVIKLIHCMQNKMQPISDVIPAFWLN